MTLAATAESEEEEKEYGRKLCGFAKDVKTSDESKWEWGKGTVVQNNLKSRCKYSATCSTICLIACAVHLLTNELMGKWMIRCLRIMLF